MHTNLPHFSSINQYQFITFRTKDSTDEFILKQLKNNNLETRIIQQNIDTYLDTSKKGSYLNDDIIDIIKKYFINLDDSLCEIIAFSIMPNHIHIILVQKTQLSEILQKIKGGLSFLINKELKKEGSLWQKDYYDKVIRSEKHYEKTYEYVKNNALKAGLYDYEKRFFSIYE
jgi:REP element-mobilizing transposase RayT